MKNHLYGIWNEWNLLNKSIIRPTCYINISIDIWKKKEK